MKKLSILVVLVLCLALLAACSDNTSGENKPAGKVTYGDGYVFTYKNVNMSPDAPAKEVIDAIPEKYEYFEAASCAFEGLDKTYTYPHIEVDTYPGDVDRIVAIYLRDDLVSTPEGLKIGDSKEAMERIYGTGYTVNGIEYTYAKGSMSLRLHVEDGKVTYICYASKVLGQVAE
ncbi:MAG: hypothetical protein II794_02240 [Oscillospiraceae bacterium]|nr:hypothetical protein [Oscillospiraceae bacterium]